jgi:hypothetical protein
LSFSSFSEAFLFACCWLANFSFSFCSCCIFCWTISSSLSIASSSSSLSFSWVFCSGSCSRMCAVFSALSLWRTSSFALHSWSVMFEGSGMWGFPLSSSWWWSWLVSAGVLFFDLFCGGIVSCFSAETQWAPMLGGIWNLGWDPWTQENKNTESGNVQVLNTIHERGDKESLKDCSRLKSCESLYTCPHAPFYRETNGLLHSENTLESKEYS